MSDCTNGGRNVYRRPWGDTEWHLPDGRTMWSDIRPTMVTVEVSDGTERHYPLALRDGQSVKGVTVDGERFCRAETIGTGTEPPEDQTWAQGASERAQNRIGGETWTA